MRLMLDLFSGLGGASEAMVQSDEWSVLRYDNNPVLADVPLTTICDLKNYELKIRQDIELIWASPPCLEFSNGYNAPKPIAQRAGEVFEPDLSLMLRAKEIIEELNPQFWIVENVVGAIKDFEPYLGSPRQIIGPFVLWGNFPLIPISKDFKHERKTDLFPSPLRSNIRAKIPLEISEALLDTLTNQKTLFDY